ncbi:MAG: hypothetical protein ACK55Z_11250, partial [bacterium]
MPASPFKFATFPAAPAASFGSFGPQASAGGSDSEKQVQLPKGSSGRVIEIDSAGDACIQFSGVPGVGTPQWVLKDNFDKLATPKQKVPWKDNL